jgi:tRNA U34 2-thiouridine synthase MnmA/TrmU
MEGVVITFDEPQKSVAPGQTVVVWDGDWCLGCGIILTCQGEYLAAMVHGSC